MQSRPDDNAVEPDDRGDLDEGGDSSSKNSELDLGLVQKLGVGVGSLMFFGAGFVQLYLWFTAMVDWLGIIGGVLAVVIAPIGGALFPFIYWAVEGAAPVLYFTVWVLGWIGAGIGYLSLME